MERGCGGGGSNRTASGRKERELQGQRTDPAGAYACVFASFAASPTHEIDASRIVVEGGSASEGIAQDGAAHEGGRVHIRLDDLNAVEIVRAKRCLHGPIDPDLHRGHAPDIVRLKIVAVDANAARSRRGLAVRKRHDARGLAVRTADDEAKRKLVLVLPEAVLGLDTAENIQAVRYQIVLSLLRENLGGFDELDDGSRRLHRAQGMPKPARRANASRRGRARGTLRARGFTPQHSSAFLPRVLQSRTHLEFRVQNVKFEVKS